MFSEYRNSENSKECNFNCYDTGLGKGINFGRLPRTGTEEEYR